MANEQRRAILRELAASGLSVVDFAERVGIHWTTLYVWRRRVTAPSSGRAAKRQVVRIAAEAAFMPVRVVDTPRTEPRAHHAERIVLSHRSGWTVLVPTAFDTDQLSAVLDAVGSRC